MKPTQLDSMNRLRVEAANEAYRLREAIREALGWMAAADRIKVTDSSLDVGQMVSIRLTGLRRLHQALTNGALASDKPAPASTLRDGA